MFAEGHGGNRLPRREGFERLDGSTTGPRLQGHLPDPLHFPRRHFLL